jgi:hypothetical protein
LDRGQRADWFDASWVCIFTIIVASSLILLVFHELRFSEPILDLSILKIPLFDIAVSMVLVMIFVVYGLSLLNPLFFQELLGYSPWKSGIAVLPRGFGSIVGMLLVGQLSRRAFDTRWLVGLGFVVLAYALSRRAFDTRWLVGLGFVVLAYALWSMSSWTLEVSIASVRFAMILSGLGTGLIFPVMKGNIGLRQERADGVVTREAAEELLQMLPHARYVDVADASHMVAGDLNDVFMLPCLSLPCRSYSKRS